MRENIMIKYNFIPVFYMTVLKIFNGDSDRINPRAINMASRSLNDELNTHFE